MNRPVKQKLAAAGMVAVLLAGGAVAAVTASGAGTGGPGARHRAGARHGRDLGFAASYLGVPASQLLGDLRSGRSLAQIADATRGKSAQGLIEAIVAQKRARLNKLSETLVKRVTGEVNRSGGPAAAGVHGLSGGGLFAGARRLGSLASVYLGIPVAQLRADLEGGRSLAQVADATSGRSAAGLVAFLVAQRKERLASKLASGRISKAQAEARSARLVRRITRAVDRVPHRP